MAKNDDGGQIIIGFPDDDGPVVQVTLRGDSAWLNQEQMATLFDVDRPVISKHIKTIFDTGEADPALVCAKGTNVGSNGRTYDITIYNLDMILSIGYRVNGKRGTEFRKWATAQLNSYLTKGFAINESKIANPANRYFDELVQKVRAIRTSEKMFYRKVTDIFATSIDYDSTSQPCREFFATVQNKFHFAIHGHTAAELVQERVDHKKPFMGLTSWDGVQITAEEASNGKNYLSEGELKRMQLLAEQFLSFAELRAYEQTPTYMADWRRKLDDFLRLNDKEILDNAGHVSQADMRENVRLELKAYNGPIKKLQRTLSKALPGGLAPDH